MMTPFGRLQCRMHSAGTMGRLAAEIPAAEMGRLAAEILIKDIRKLHIWRRARRKKLRSRLNIASVILARGIASGGRRGALWRSWSRHQGRCGGVGHRRHRSGSCSTRVRFPGSVEHWQCSIVAVNSLSSSCPPPNVQFRLSLIKASSLHPVGSRLH